MTANETTYYFRAAVGVGACDEPVTTGCIEISRTTEPYKTVRTARKHAQEDAAGMAEILVETLPYLTLVALRDKLIEECRALV